MLSKLRPRITYANVVSTLCLFIVLGGTSYAVATGSIGSREIKDNSIRGKDIRTGTVRSSDVGNGSLRAGDFKAGQLPAGPAGATGPQGPKGDQGLKGEQGEPGTPATRLFAVVNGSTGALKSGFSSGVVGSARTGAGQYTVSFDRVGGLRGCAILATPGFLFTETGDIYQFGSRATVKTDTVGTVIVETVNNAGALTDRSFSIAAFCA